MENYKKSYKKIFQLDLLLWSQYKWLYCQISYDTYSLFKNNKYQIKIKLLNKCTFVTISFIYYIIF